MNLKSEINEFPQCILDLELSVGRIVYVKFDDRLTNQLIRMARKDHAQCVRDPGQLR